MSQTSIWDHFEQYGMGRGRGYSPNFQLNLLFVSMFAIGEIRDKSRESG